MTIGAAKILQILNGAIDETREKFAFLSTVPVEMGIYGDRLT